MFDGSGGRPAAISPLFQVREPPRRFLGPIVLVVVLHVAVLGWALRAHTSLARTPPAPVTVALRLPIRKVAVNDAPGGGPKRPPAARHPVRRRLIPPAVIPPPVVEPPEPVPDPPQLADAEDLGDDDAGDDDAGPGIGGGPGGGIGPGVGSGQGSVKSKARKAWLARTDWRCFRPGYDELGRVVVRIRVEVRLDGRPGPISIVKPGPEAFNQRAIDCARAETYLPELDPEGNPIPGSAEFGIEFLN
ncbi:MAG TPA: hypothetical protein VMH40_08445 [Myxococcaceae bacterium]|nr:hypothetical protein [Myxococcaceae bacterium]